MKRYRKSSAAGKVFLVLAVLAIATACASVDTHRTEKSTGQIFLYGEGHGIPRILERQLEIWHDYYHNQNMRHMFIEFEYFTTEFLNMWMQSDNDDILYELFDEWVGSLAHNPYVLMFFKTIKSEFPETVFHGVDVGHGFQSTGERFLRYLRDNGMQGTERYLLTLESMEQGKRFSRNPGQPDRGFRATAKAENFIREFDRLGNQNVMGIFGAAHTRFGLMDAWGFPGVPTLAERLRWRYGDSLHTTDLLLWFRLGNEPTRVDTITVNGVDYDASYFGTIAFGGHMVSGSFWRLENAYDDFCGKPANGVDTFHDDFPLWIELNQVIILDIAFTDGSVSRMFFRYNGVECPYWGKPLLTGFSVE